MGVSLIVACTGSGGIGIDNGLPWRIKQELAFFRKMTTGSGNNCIVMGRNTLLSLPKAPLPNRTNCIISTTIESVDGCTVFKTLEACIDWCGSRFDEVFIIGGAQLYSHALELKLIDRIYRTIVNRVDGNEISCTVYIDTALHGFRVTSNRVESTPEYSLEYQTLDLIQD